MEAYIERDNKTVTITGSNVRDVLEKLGINPVTVIVTRNNELVTEETTLKKGDSIKIISVVSGG